MMNCLLYCRGSWCPDSLLRGRSLCGCGRDIWEASGAAGLRGETRPQICHDIPAWLPTLLNSLGATHYTAQKISFYILLGIVLHLCVTWLKWVEPECGFYPFDIQIHFISLVKQHGYALALECLSVKTQVGGAFFLWSNNFNFPNKTH